MRDQVPRRIASRNGTMHQDDSVNNEIETNEKQLSEEELV